VEFAFFIIPILAMKKGGKVWNGINERTILLTTKLIWEQNGRRKGTVQWFCIAPKKAESKFISSFRYQHSPHSLLLSNNHWPFYQLGWQLASRGQHGQQEVQQRGTEQPAGQRLNEIGKAHDDQSCLLCSKCDNEKKLWLKSIHCPLN